MPKVFISHSSIDRRFVGGELVPILNNHGIETWYSTDDIRTADEWEGKIRDALRACDWFLVVLSRNSVASDWVKTEVHWAIENRQKRLIPLLLSSCNVEDLHLKLSRIQYIDFRKDRQSAWLNLLKTWDRELTQIPDDPASPVSRAEEEVNQTNQAVGFRDAELQQLTLRFEFVATGQVVEADVSPSLQVAQLIRMLMQRMGFSDRFEDGRIADTQLRSKTRGVLLNSSQTLEENEVEDGEVLHLLFQAHAGRGPRVVAGDPFGTIVGEFNGVLAYSNGDNRYFSEIVYSIDSCLTGCKWQCVEYASRYYYQVYGLAIGGGSANTWYADAARKGLKSYPNGGTVKPEVGDILCSQDNRLGHVAIIRKVGAARVVVIQQNWSNTVEDNALELDVTQEDDRYSIREIENYSWQGWLRR